MFRFICRISSVVCAFALLGGLFPLPVRAAARDPFPASDGKWRHYQSPNFELYSTESDHRSRTLLHKLEVFRAIFIDTAKFVERQRLEVTICLFARAKDFQAYLPANLSQKANFGAFYSGNRDRAMIVMGPSEGEAEAQAVVFHEYIHHLVGVSGEMPPAWINEGLAELFSSLVVNEDSLEFGRPSRGRVYEARGQKLMPLAVLFAVDQDSAVFRAGEHTGLFYSESWALLHYWYFGQSGIPLEKAEQFVRYLRTNPGTQGEALRKYFRETFDMDYPEMEQRLWKYLNGGSYRWRKAVLPKVDPASSYTVRPMPAAEVRLRLAELALRSNRSALAKLVLLEATQSNPGDPRPLEALGAEALRDDDERTARERWQQALDAGTRNPAIYREFGRLEGRAWFQQVDIYLRMPVAKTERLRELLRKSIEYSPLQTDAYEMLACVEAYSEKPSVANVNLVQVHFPSLKNREVTWLALAVVRERLGDNTTAIQMLDELEKLQPQEAIRYGIESLRAKIENRPINWEEKARVDQKTLLSPQRIELPRRP